MALSVLRRHQDPYILAATALIERNGASSDVLEVVLTPRPAAPPGVAPTPVVRGPQTGINHRLIALSPQEDQLAEEAFKKVDVKDVGEVDSFKLLEMFGHLKIPMAMNIAKAWLSDHPQTTGFTVADFKVIYGQILAAQTPAVRKASARGSIKLAELASTEKSMRLAFEKLAQGDRISPSRLCSLFKTLHLPDVHGDQFERFVGEWLALEGLEVEQDELALTFHDFVSCINLLIDFIDRQE